MNASAALRLKPAHERVSPRRLQGDRSCPPPLLRPRPDIYSGSHAYVPAWYVCGVHPPVPDRIHVGVLSPSCLDLHPLVLALPTARVRFCPRCTCPRLILCCTCPPMCIWARWPMPACAWRDVQSVSVFYLTFVFSVT